MRGSVRQSNHRMAVAKSRGCLLCHQGEHEPHGKPGDGAAWSASAARRQSLRRRNAWRRFPRFIPEGLGRVVSANPSAFVLRYLNPASRPNFIRFVNRPATFAWRIRELRHDLGATRTRCYRFASLYCRTGHALGRVALYNNRPFRYKRSLRSAKAAACTAPRMDPDRAAAHARIRGRPKKGVVPFLGPLPRYGFSAGKRPPDLRARSPRPARGWPAPAQPVRGQRGRPKAGLSMVEGSEPRTVPIRRFAPAKDPATRSHAQLPGHE